MARPKKEVIVEKKPVKAKAVGNASILFAMDVETMAMKNIGTADAEQVKRIKKFLKE